MIESIDRKADWLVIRNGSACCDRCKAEEKIPVPMPLVELPTWLREFRDKHIDCAEGGAA